MAMQEIVDLESEGLEIKVRGVLDFYQIACNVSESSI